MFKYRIYLSVFLILLAPFYPSILYAAERKAPGTETDKMLITIGGEYLSPQEASRDISTVNTNAYYQIKDFKNINLSIHAGLTATYATGIITQLEGTLEEGSLREVKYDNEAFGFGPSLLGDIYLCESGGFSFHLKGGGSVILYNKDFPTGGDRYNFMWRVGPFAEYAFGNHNISIGYLWMHVSNGQGTGPQNPSYDAQGVSLHYAIAF